MEMRMILLALAAVLALADGARAGMAEGVAAYRRGDHEAALREWQPLAEQGNAEAQRFLGDLHGRGEGVSRNFTESARWYGKAAEQGDWQAQTAFGFAHLMGLGVRMDAAKGLRLLRDGAERGHPLFRMVLAGLYSAGRFGVPRDQRAALRWLREAGDAGEPIAQTVLAAMYWIGPGRGAPFAVRRDAKEAVRWLERAAGQGVSVAQLGLAAAYRQGEGVSKDPVQAYRWASLGFDGLARDVSLLVRVLEAGGALAQVRQAFQEAKQEIDSLEPVLREAARTLGEAAKTERDEEIAKRVGESLVPHVARAIKSLGEPADRMAEAFTGLTAALKTEVLAFLEGDMAAADVARAKALARQWRPTVVAGGATISTPSGTITGFNYAEMIERGLAVAGGLPESALAFVDAHAGVAEAQYRLGGMYAEGREVAQDSGEAARWHRKAADQGHAGAMHALGLMYAAGRGVHKDLDAALRWHFKAAEAGYAEAQFQLGRALDEGRGARRDAGSAAKWYLRAAERGHAESQLSLGLSYADGKGVPKDPVRAYMWLHLAASDSEDEVRRKAEKARDELQARMDRGQVKEARDMARDWKPLPSVEREPQTAASPGRAAPRARPAP
jgi:TPR repeat protein